VATSARFGRLPRSAPSLTSTIVALAQEYQRVRDNNIEEAWKNGGQFEGKKVTDDMMLAYWKERRDSVSKDDPMYDYYANLLHGYEFNIAESSAYLKYKQGKISDAAMAAFYRKWANKMPSDSANWRSLMTKAAEFKAASARRSAAGAAQARATAYGNQQEATYNAYEKKWDIFSDFTTRSMGYAGGDYGGWGNFTQSAGDDDATEFETLVWNVNNNPAYAGQKAELQKQIGFKGDLTLDMIESWRQSKIKGTDERTKRAIKYGDTKTNIDNIGREKASARVAGVAIKTTDYQQASEEQRRDLMNVLEDPNATPMQKQEALRNARKWFNDVGSQMLQKAFPNGALDPTSKNYDDAAFNQWKAHTQTIDALDGKRTGNTVWDDPNGRGGAEAGPNSFATYLQDASKSTNTAVNLIKSGEVLTRTDDDGNISTTGKHWETMRPDDARLGGEGVFLTTDRDGILRATKARPIVVDLYPAKDKQGKALGAGGLDPNTGLPVGDRIDVPGQDENVGYYMDYDAGGGNTVRLYGVFSNGQLKWSHTPPFREGAQTGETDKGMRVQVGGVDRGKATVDAAIDRDSIGATGADSPTRAAIQSTPAVSKAITSLSDETVRRNEAAYFAQHPTKEMKDWLAAHPTKTVSGGIEYRNTIYDAAYETEAKDTVNAKQSAAYWGVGSQRDITYRALQQKAEAERKANLARDAEQNAAYRQQLARDVEAWRANEVAQKGFMTPVGRRVVGGEGQTFSIGPLKVNLHQRIDMNAQEPTVKGLPPGMSVAALLASPDISTAEAKKWANYLTNGKLGEGETKTVEEQAYGYWGPLNMRYELKDINGKPLTQKKTVTTPILKPPTATPTTKPKETKPKEETKPKTGPAAGPTAGYTGPAGSPIVNPNTGFVTGTNGPAAGPNAATYQGKTNLDYMRRKYGVPY
jgi:hypothetical protein